jgi:hypothetical protein
VVMGMDCMYAATGYAKRHDLWTRRVGSIPRNGKGTLYGTAGPAVRGTVDVRYKSIVLRIGSSELLTW